jgi:glutathione S-transferase
MRLTRRHGILRFMSKPTLTRPVASHPELVLCELVDPGIPGVESHSPFCIKVHRALRAAGLAYERRFADRPDAYAKYNPTRQVPVLLVDGAPVCDSTLIVARIEAMAGRFAPALDASARAEAWLWEEFADTALNAFVVAARWADDRNWPTVRDAYFGTAPWIVRALVAPRIRAKVIGALVARDVWRRGADACWARFELLLDHLEWRAPVRGFWLGDALSVADIAIFAQLQSLRTDLTPAQREMLASRAELSAYLDRVDRATSAEHAASQRYMLPAVVHALIAEQPAA